MRRLNKLGLKLGYKILNMNGEFCIANQDVVEDVVGVAVTTSSFFLPPESLTLEATL